MIREPSLVAVHLRSGCSGPIATPDESGTSGSDFEETQKAVEAKRKELARHGRPVSDMEADDASLDRELESLATDSDTSLVGRRRRRQIKRGKKPARNDDQEQALQGESVTAVADDEDHLASELGETIAVDTVSDDDDDDDDDFCDWKCVKGPLPDAGRTMVLVVLLKLLAAISSIVGGKKSSTCWLQLALYA